MSKITAENIRDFQVPGLYDIGIGYGQRTAHIYPQQWGIGATSLCGKSSRKIPMMPGYVKLRAFWIGHDTVCQACERAYWKAKAAK